jgi:hypothetical protein
VARGLTESKLAALLAGKDERLRGAIDTSVLFRRPPRVWPGLVALDLAAPLHAAASVRSARAGAIVKEIDVHGTGQRDGLS